MSEDQLPEPLRDKIIKKGPKGPTGQLIVRRITGVENNKAAQIVRQFEENTGGKEDIVEKLEAIRDTLPRGQLVLLELLKSNSKKKLPRLLAETNVELGSLMKSYSNGALMLGQTAAIIEAARNLPRVMKDLASHALDGTQVCSVCVGSGKVTARKGESEETKGCPMCRGTGETLISSKHKKFAVQKILEVGKMVEKHGPTVNVNQQVGVKVSGGGAVMEKIALMADEILHGRPVHASPEEIVEAEVIPKND